MVSSIIEGIRNYIASVPLMSEFDSKHRHIDWTDADNDNYGIFPDTDNLVDEYVDGTQIRQYICQINIRKFAVLDADRLKTVHFWNACSVGSTLLPMQEICPICPTAVLPLRSRLKMQCSWSLIHRASEVHMLYKSN